MDLRTDKDIIVADTNNHRIQIRDKTSAFNSTGCSWFQEREQGIPENPGRFHAPSGGRRWFSREQRDAFSACWERMPSGLEGISRLLLRRWLAR
ncbi:hypothetical protein HN011_010299 [Eciton burchellii]|nr:hypothetical protein HN011_010299 [Eciton burchellii]